MTDPNRPIIETRSTVMGGHSVVAPSSARNGSATSSTATGNAPSTAPATGNAASSTTTGTRKPSSPIATTIPDEFKGSSYDELIPHLEKKVAEYRPLTEEELKKLRKKQRAEGIISGISDAVRSVANLIATHNYAPNMYNPTDGMSARAKARFEKEKAEREAEEDRWFNYAMTLGKLRGADKDRGLQVWQAEQTLARQDRAFDAGRKDREDDVAFRNKDYDERMRQWQANFDRQGEWHEEEGQRWERQFKESVRQFNVSAANERARINMESQRLAHSLKEGLMTFDLGSGNGNVTLTLDRLNAQTVSRIYSTLPAEVRSKVQGDPIVQNGFVVGYKPPTTEAMLIAIGANVESSPATQNAIKQVAGLETGKKPAGY